MERANKPLTLEQLRGIDGQPVWIKDLKTPECSGWRMIYWDRGKYLVLIAKSIQGYILEEYGESWLAYAQQPAHIDPETLSIVRQLREELAMVTAERDAAVADLRKLVPAWKWDGQKEKMKNEDN